MTKTTDFGFQQIPIEEKRTQVERVFTSVADKYDLMNDVMSLGIHRLWKKFAVTLCQVRAGYRVLDIASGTGDLAAAFSRQVGLQGQVILSDINATILNRGRDKLLERGIYANCQFVQANAECLPFPEDYFDSVTIAFGLRNVTDKNAALRSMYRVVKPGGRVLILEFSQPSVASVAQLYDLYSFHVLPKLGKLIANDEASYRYLVESIRMHPPQEVLKEMILTAGFDRCEVFNLSLGIVAVHYAIKY